MSSNTIRYNKNFEISTESWRNCRITIMKCYFFPKWRDNDLTVPTRTAVKPWLHVKQIILK